MLVLTISHNIFLTKSNIEEIRDGNIVVVTGVSNPIWFYKGITTEPAQEVFCNYGIRKADSNVRVGPMPDGYFVLLPAGTSFLKKEDTDQWRAELQSRIKLGIMLHEEVPRSPATIGTLVSSGHLRFRIQDKRKIGSHPTTVIHYVEISPVEELVDSLI